MSVLKKKIDKILKQMGVAFTVILAISFFLMIIINSNEEVYPRILACLYASAGILLFIVYLKLATLHET